MPTKQPNILILNNEKIIAIRSLHHNTFGAGGS